MRRQNNPHTFMTQSEEDEFDDKLLAKIDELLTPQPSPMTSMQTKASQDKFFDEIVSMLEASDRESSRHVVTSEEEEEFNSKDFFDQILKEIPKNDRPHVHWHDNKTSSERQNEIDMLECDLKKIDARMYADRKHAAYIQKVKLEIADPVYIDRCLLHRKGIDKQHEADEKRVMQYLQKIEHLISQLAPWSPAKNQYKKILRNKIYSPYDKVQQLIFTANEITKKIADTKKGFLLERLTQKADDIHARIAEIDLNAEIRRELTVVTFVRK